MKSKGLLSILMIFALTMSVFAKDINISQAEKVAVNFLFQKSNQYGDAIGYHDLNITDSYKVDNAYYVINFEEGWVIVSAEDATTPVIGYNFEGRFPEKDTYSYNFGSYMQVFVDQVDYINANNIEASDEIANEWNTYLTDDYKSLNTRGDRDIAALLTSTWNQNNPYNAMCPEDEDGPGGRVYVGCVATCMSMIMHYWRYPLVGEGSHSYYCYPYGTQSVDYSAQTYNWDAMTDNINSQYVWEIAKIGYHAAVSVDMGFGPDGSGAYSNNVPEALRTYFGIQTSVQYIQKNMYTTSQWEGFLQASLDDYIPLYYSGQSTSGGHAFACDGYQGSNYYHFNFGWSGSGNGYYTLEDVNGFNSNQAMVRNIYPADADYPYIAEGLTELTTLAGSFTDGSGPIEDYPSGMDAQWLINPQNEEDSVTSLTLSFIEFDTDASDVLKVYDGSDESATLLGEFSGSSIPSDISSSGNTLFITFTSSGTGTGFKAEYESVIPSYCSNTTVVEDAYGTLSDGSGSFNYNNSTVCNFRLQHPEAVKYHLTFTEFATEEENDVLTIYDVETGDVIAELSGEDTPGPYEVETSALLLRWITNAIVRDAGWEFEFSVDGVGIEETSFSNLNIYPNPTSGILNVNFDAENSGAVNVKVVSVNGQVIINDNIEPQMNSYSQSYDISNCSKGVYLMSITSDNEKIDKKIVLK